MSGDSVADDMLRAGYERWYRLEEEKSAIGEDLKELFAELKGNGFTPKALRESFRRVRNINDADQQEHDAIVDLYVSSLTGARPAREARVEIIDEFPVEHDEDGVFPDDEPQSPSAASDLAVSGPSGQVAPIQPETANEITDQPTNGGDHETAAHPEPVNLDRRPGTTGPEVGQNGSEHQRAEHIETNTAPAGRAADESSATNITTLRQPKQFRPNCLNRQGCAASGPSECYQCSKAAAQRGATA